MRGIFISRPRQRENGRLNPHLTQRVSPLLIQIEVPRVVRPALVVRGLERLQRQIANDSLGLALGTVIDPIGGHTHRVPTDPTNSQSRQDAVDKRELDSRAVENH